MNKCFITKLPSSVDNDNLPVLGQLRINWLKQSDLTDNDARAIGLSTNDSITVKVSGAHLTDSTLASNIGNTKTITSADGLVWLYVSNDTDAVLTIDNKYSLTVLNFAKDRYKQDLARSIYFDINDIKYCTNLTYLTLSTAKLNGDINAISNLTNLTYLSLYQAQFSGDINAISNLTNLTHLDLESNQISGNINVISNLTNLTYLNLGRTLISGDINAISNLTNIDHLFLSRTQITGDISALRNLTNMQEMYINDLRFGGDIASFANFTKLPILNLNGTSVTGDMSKLPANMSLVSFYGRKVNTNFTWTAKGRQNATLLAIKGGAPFDTTSMDNMLIDQATCTVTSGRDNVIEVSGTRTSASDAAVETLQNKGVTITGVTKVS